MITAEEGVKMRNIKARVLADNSGNSVSSQEKQWVLDIVKREQVTVRAAVVQRANNSGFNTTGIRTK